jgi:hypothetical protein
MQRKIVVSLGVLSASIRIIVTKKIGFIHPTEANDTFLMVKSCRKTPKLYR